jgi:hypothetical protein
LPIDANRYLILAENTQEDSEEEDSAEEVDLRDPLLAALLAAVLPGLGHFYPRRYAKSILFFICILGTFLFGWDLGGGRVVYASWRPGDKRWPYLCQVWVGLPAWPALIQTAFEQPFGDFMRAPDLTRNHEFAPNEMDEWHKTYHTKFELGTVFTMIAGLLNILAIFDAAAGPVGSSPVPRDDDRIKKRHRREQRDEAESQRDGSLGPRERQPTN